MSLREVYLKDETDMTIYKNLKDVSNSIAKYIDNNEHPQWILNRTIPAKMQSFV